MRVVIQPSKDFYLQTNFKSNLLSLRIIKFPHLKISFSLRFGGNLLRHEVKVSNLKSLDQGNFYKEERLKLKRNVPLCVKKDHNFQ